MKQYKKVTLYEIREYVGNEYSKQIGSKLRNKQRVNRILKRLKTQKRELIVIPWQTIRVPGKPKTQPLYQFETKPWVDIYIFANTIKH
jgi:hypothetical protein